MPSVLSREDYPTMPFSPACSDQPRSMLSISRGSSVTVFALLLTIASLAPCGCTHKNQAHYTPVVNENQVCLRPDDLGVPPEAFTKEGRTILDPSPSVGRFPTGLAVVGVKAVVNHDHRQRSLHIDELADHSTVYWMHLWDDLPPIREVIRLRTLGIDPRGTAVSDLLREARGNNCGLCLIVGTIEDVDADACLVAALWDAVNQKPLSFYRTAVMLPDEIREEYSKPVRHGRYTDEAKFRAEADLRLLVRDTLWDMTQTDRPREATEPSPWQDYVPLFPSDYDRVRRLNRLLELQREREPKPDQQPPQ